MTNHRPAIRPFVSVAAAPRRRSPFPVAVVVLGTAIAAAQPASAAERAPSTLAVSVLTVLNNEYVVWIAVMVLLALGYALAGARSRRFRNRRPGRF